MEWGNLCRERGVGVSLDSDPEEGDEEEEDDREVDVTSDVTDEAGNP